MWQLYHNRHIPQESGSLFQLNNALRGQEASSAPGGKCRLVATHCDEAVRLDLVDPEALFHHAARSVQQLFELAQGEGSYLWDAQGERLHHSESKSRSASHEDRKQSVRGSVERTGQAAGLESLDCHKMMSTHSPEKHQDGVSQRGDSTGLTSGASLRLKLMLSENTNDATTFQPLPL